MLPVPLLLSRLTQSTAVGGKGAAQRQPKFLTNASSVPGLVANPTADTLVGSWCIDTSPTGTRAGIHALIDICQETQFFQAPKGKQCSSLQCILSRWFLRVSLQGTVIPNS